MCVADAVLRGPAKRQAIGCGLLARLIAHTSLIADAQSAFAATVVPAALHLLKENLANSRARPLKNTLAADSGACHSHDDCCRSCLLCWGFPDRRALTHMRACVRACVRVCVCGCVHMCMSGVHAALAVCAAARCVLLVPQAMLLPEQRRVLGAIMCASQTVFLHTLSHSTVCYLCLCVCECECVCVCECVFQRGVSAQPLSLFGCLRSCCCCRCRVGPDCVAFLRKMSAKLNMGSPQLLALGDMYLDKPSAEIFGACICVMPVSSTCPPCLFLTPTLVCDSSWTCILSLCCRGVSCSGCRTHGLPGPVSHALGCVHAPVERMRQRGVGIAVCARRVARVCRSTGRE